MFSRPPCRALPLATTRHAFGQNTTFGPQTASSIFFSFLDIHFPRFDVNVPFFLLLLYHPLTRPSPDLQTTPFLHLIPAKTRTKSQLRVMTFFSAKTNSLTPVPATTNCFFPASYRFSLPFRVFSRHLRLAWTVGHFGLGLTRTNCLRD